MFFVSETSSGHHWKCRGMDGKLKSKERKTNEKNGESSKTAALLVLTLLFGLFPIRLENNLNKVQAATTLNNPRTVADSSMNAKQKVTWDCVWFGAYPQSEVTSGDIYNKLKNATGWDENNDIVIDGNKIGD